MNSVFTPIKKCNQGTEYYVQRHPEEELEAVLNRLDIAGWAELEYEVVEGDVKIDGGIIYRVTAQRVFCKCNDKKANK